jgi:hypothetical protein
MPTHEQIMRLENYLDEIQRYGITGEIRNHEDNDGYKSLYIWDIKNPGNQKYVGASRFIDDTIFMARIVLTILENDNYREIDIDANYFYNKPVEWAEWKSFVLELVESV